MQLRHVLAVVDFSTDAGINAAWKAAHLAWAHGAELCLMACVQVPDRAPASRFGPTAPPARARADLLHLATDIRRALSLCPAVVVGVGAQGEEVLGACARRADLVVVPDDRKLAERLVSGHGATVLRVRLPHSSSHRSAMVIHEPDGASLASLLGAAQWLCKPDGVHALALMDRRRMQQLRTTDQPLSSIHALGQTAHRHALEGLQAQLTRAGLRRDQGSVLPAGCAAGLAKEQVRRAASVIVLGGRRQPPWMAFLWPGLARQLVERVTCDALLLPARMASAKEARWSLRESRRDPVASQEAWDETAPALPRFACTAAHEGARQRLLAAGGR